MQVNFKPQKFMKFIPFFVLCTKRLLVSYYNSETADKARSKKGNFHDKPQQVFDQNKFRSP